MSAFGLSERGLCLIFSLDQCCVLELCLQNSSSCPLKEEVEGVIFSCGFVELYTVVCVQGRCDARWLCSYVGRHITVDAASGMLQQEAWRAKRQPAFCFSTLWTSFQLIPSPQNVDWELQSSLQEEQQEEPHERWCWCWEEGQRSALLLQGSARV